MQKSVYVKDRDMEVFDRLDDFDESDSTIIAYSLRKFFFEEDSCTPGEIANELRVLADRIENLTKLAERKDVREPVLTPNKNKKSV